MGEHGVKETKEAILALVILGKFVAERLKDGVQIEDAMALVTKLMDEEFKTKVMAGVDGLDKVALEVKDLKLAEVIELAQVLPELLDLFKKA